jgi:phosphopantetheinyl transferase (holo-ACP synthase)
VDGAGPLAITAEGAPRLAGRPELHLSLSHRRGWQAAAVSDAPVGVDVEVRAPRDVEALAERFCSARERRRLADLTPDEALTHLHALWALKEAAYKAAFPAQAGLHPDRLESRAASDGAGSARAWRWPDGRVLAVAAGAFAGFEARGLDGAEGPACWDVLPVEPV